MGWTCQNCGAHSESDSLDFPIMHETLHPDHKVEPDLRTVSTWSKVL